MATIPEQGVKRHGRLGSPDASFVQPGGPPSGNVTGDPDAGGRSATTIRPMIPPETRAPHRPTPHYGEADDAPLAQTPAEMNEPNTGSEPYVTLHEHEGKSRTEHQTVQGLDALHQAGAI